MLNQRLADVFESGGNGGGSCFGSGVGYSDLSGTGEGTSCGEGKLTFSGAKGRGDSDDLTAEGNGAGNAQGCGNGAGSGPGDSRFQPSE